MSESTRLPAELTAGDMIDLEAIYEALAPGSDPDRVAWWRYEYAVVIGVEVESPDCVRVDYEGGAYGLPSDFRVRVIGGAS